MSRPPKRRPGGLRDKLLHGGGVHVGYSEASVDDYAFDLKREDDFAIGRGFYGSAVDRGRIDESGLEGVASVFQRLSRAHGDGVNSEVRVMHQGCGVGGLIQFPY